VVEVSAKELLKLLRRVASATSGEHNIAARLHILALRTWPYTGEAVAPVFTLVNPDVEPG